MHKYFLLLLVKNTSICWALPIPSRNGRECLYTNCLVTIGVNLHLPLCTTSGWSRHKYLLSAVSLCDNWDILYQTQGGSDESGFVRKSRFLAVSSSIWSKIILVLIFFRSFKHFAKYTRRIRRSRKGDGFVRHLFRAGYY